MPGIFSQVRPRNAITIQLQVPDGDGQASQAGRRREMCSSKNVDDGRRLESAENVACDGGRSRLRLLAAGCGGRRHLLRLRGQEGPVPAARLAAGRDGRSDAGQRVDPCRDDGCRRRVSGRAILSGVYARGAAGDRLRRLHHAVHGRHDRAHGHGHQASAGLFDGQPAGLHDAGPRVGGWSAGMLHLFTHAFFKSLLFLCSGSVIHAAGTNEMPQMGGLRRKCRIRPSTMLIGCLAIAGAGIPTVIGLSGYYSKDYMIAQALFLWTANPVWLGCFLLSWLGRA